MNLRTLFALAACAHSYFVQYLPNKIFLRLVPALQMLIYFLVLLTKSTLCRSHNVVLFSQIFFDGHPRLGIVGEDKLHCG